MERKGLSKEESRHAAVDEYVKEFSGSRGRKLLLPQSIHDKLLALLSAIRAADGKVSPLIVMCVAEGVLRSEGKETLPCSKMEET